MKYCLSVFIGLICLATSAEGQTRSANKEMLNMLAAIASKISSPENPFATGQRMQSFSSSLESAANFEDSLYWQYMICRTHLELGDEDSAIALCAQMIEQLNDPVSAAPRESVKKLLALAFLRRGERINCIHGHNAETCIFPIAGKGIQQNTGATEKSIELYKEILQQNPEDLESRWLLNIAYMAIGQYPAKVPLAYLIKGLDKEKRSDVKPFTDVAMQTGLTVNNMSGGSIVEDFNNDGYLDVITSGWGLDEEMHYFQNDTLGSFKDLSSASGVAKLSGGLNIMQTDYNNDGWKDVFIVRGAWMGTYGEQPNSLLRNNGNGTFTDVTRESGLLSFHPTQTATWADFNNDGWLDVFIGNETSSNRISHPCELYINNKNGTFTESAKQAGVDISLFVKGVTSGDYDNDNDVDVFLSTFGGNKILLKNEGVVNGSVRFTDVSQKAGFAKNLSVTFTTWFFDYDNDGWLDILCSGYDFDKSLAGYAAGEALGIDSTRPGKILIYRNLHNGKFREVSKKLGLNTSVFAMGANFGDINNDGYLDMYLGTGNPSYQSLVPNKMFLNKKGKRFADVTGAARVGHLQKGHGVAFADMDNDGDEDIYIDMGGAYVGDAYQNSLFVNPGQNDNGWIKVSLEGTTSNKAAIGAKLTVTFEENGKTRHVYREINSGGSFGSNPLVQHIGTGRASVIKKIDIQWPASGKTQHLENLKTGQHIIITEGNDTVRNITLTKFDFSRPNGSHHHHH